jgi:hypothetical protein
MEPVKSLVVPLGWSCELDEPNFNSPARSIFYFPNGAPDAVLMFFNRGYPVAGEEVDAFKELLARGQNNGEPMKLDGRPIHLNVESVKKSIPQVLGNLVDVEAFEMSNAGVVEINGRKTLMVEGTWLASAKKFHGYLLPSDTASGAIQEIFFESVEPNFSKYLPIAQRAINSVKWSA